METPNFPKCFLNADSWRIYKELNTGKNGERIVPHYCWDCTSKYQKAAIEADECGHPETFFVTVTNEHGEEEEIGILL